MNQALNMDGGIHEIPVPALAGRLWLCGKHFIGPDHAAVLQRVGASHVVCLVREGELRGRYDEYVNWLQTSNCSTWYPIHDLSSPPLEEILPLYQGVIDRLRRGESVIAHCAAGIGDGRVWVCFVATGPVAGAAPGDGASWEVGHRVGAGGDSRGAAG